MTKRPEVVNISRFHALAASGATKPGLQIRLALASEPVVGDTERVASFVFSDSSVDSYGDTIDVRGWDLKAFEANPIALFGHDGSKKENIIGKARNVRVQGSRLVGDIVFAEASVNPDAEMVYQMVKGGYLNAVSVGFEPVEWKAAGDKNRPGGIDFTKQKLREISIVAIPANENALVQAKAAGIDVDRLQLTAPIITRDFKVTKRGLYSVSSLASLLSELGWLQDSVEWEAEYEGDGSDIPSRLLEAMKGLGQILVDMTVEEVSELLGVEGDLAAEPTVSDIVELAAPSEAQKTVLAIAKMALVARPVAPPTVDKSAVDKAAEEAEAIASRLRKAKALKLQTQLAA
jgi:HK97 family phage prohead protease